MGEGSMMDHCHGHNWSRVRQWKCNNAVGQVLPIGGKWAVKRICTVKAQVEQ